MYCVPSKSYPQLVPISTSEQMAWYNTPGNLIPFVLENTVLEGT